MRTIQRNLLKLITLTLGLVVPQVPLHSFDSYTILHNPVSNQHLLILSELADEKCIDDPNVGSFIKQPAGKINELKKLHPIAPIPFVIDLSESEQEKLRHPQNWSELSPDFQWLLSPTTALHNTFKLVSCESRKMASFILNFIRDEGLVFFTAEQLQRNDTTNITTYPGYAQWKNYMLKYINHGRFPVSFFFQAYENYFNQMEQWGNEYPLGSAQRRIFEENKTLFARNLEQLKQELTPHLGTAGMQSPVGDTFFKRIEQLRGPAEIHGWFTHLKKDYVSGLDCIYSATELLHYFLSNFHAAQTPTPIFMISPGNGLLLRSYVEALGYTTVESKDIAEYATQVTTRLFKLETDETNLPIFLKQLFDHIPRLYPQTCNHCSKAQSETHTLSRCTGCKKAFYCDRACQVNDWQTHRQHCSRAAQQ